MKGLIWGTICIALLGGCATGRTTGGAFSEVPPGYSDVMAIDAANQLSHVFPPATSRLVLATKADDPFGVALVGKLRFAGYAVQEGGSISAASGSSLAYVLDSIDQTTYRVSLLVAGETLSRAYVVADRRLSPSGVWARGR